MIVVTYSNHPQYSNWVVPTITSCAYISWLMAGFRCSVGWYLVAMCSCAPVEPGGILVDGGDGQRWLPGLVNVYSLRGTWPSQK